MRGLALLLLLANIIFLGWQLSWLPSWLPWQPSDFIKDAPSDEPPISDLPRLVLLNESHSVNNVASASASEKISHGQVSTNNPSKKNGLAPVEALKIKEEDEKPKAIEGKELLTGKMTPVYNNDDTNVSEKHGTFENSSPRENIDTYQNRQDVNPGKDVGKMPTDSTAGDAHTVAASSSSPAKELENISKPKNSPLAEEVKVAQAAPAPIKVAQPPVKKASSVTCFKAGPYMPLAEAKKVADWLKNQEEVSVEVKNREIPVSTKTWVYLPSLGSRQAATRVVQRLTQQGVTGSQVTEPNYAISLGVFENKENATRRVKELQAKGYNEVKTEEHHKNETTYWLSVKIADNPKSVLSAFGKRFKEGPVPEEGTCE